MQLYMHNVWVNWFEGEENIYNICEYFEWRKDDSIEVLEQVPLIYISKELFSYIANDMHDLPEELLKKIRNKTSIRKTGMRETIEYTAIVTDGERVIAFDTIGYTIPIRKSRLIPRQERVVFNLISKQKPKRFVENFSIPKKEHHILSLHPKYMIGLTRRERQLKQLLMISLDQLKNNCDVDELRYWLTEWNPANYEYIFKMNADDIWEILYKEMRKSWSKTHEDILEKMVKRNPFLEKMWELEQTDSSEQNTLH